MSKLEVFREFWDYLKVRKKYWLAPIFIILFLLGLIMILGQSSTAATPFIYVLF